MAADHIIYCLERVTDYDQFERLCHDLMARNGYPNIEPLGRMKDKGRDALHVPRRDPSLVTVFAYSVREDWRKKLEEDCRKVKKHRHKCHRIAFLSTADFTASERDEAVASVKREFGWELELYGLERLRVLVAAAPPQLIQNHPQIFPPAFFPHPGLPWLNLIAVQRRLKQDPITSEIQLLDAYRRTIGLVGREKDMEGLWAWVHDKKRPISVRVVTGRAGAGKTRLAIELMLRLQEECPGQWWAGFLTSEELSRFVAQQNLSAWGWDRPTLAVMDYAAIAGPALERCLRELAENTTASPDKPLRLLLLEREASVEEGWFRSLRDLERRQSIGDRVRAFFDPPEPISLQKLESAAHRRQVFQAMLDVAAKHLRVKPPPLPPPKADPIVDRQLEAKDWEDPLYLMMAALMASHYQDIVKVLGLSRTDLARELAGREIQRIERFASDASVAAKRLLRVLAAYATLGRGLTHAKAVEAAEQEGQVRRLLYPDGYGTLVMRLHEALPGPDGGIAGIQPDIIAEALVLDVLKQEPPEQRAETVLRGAKQLGPAVPKLVILTTQDYCEGNELEPLKWLDKLVQAGVADDLGLLAAVEDALPHPRQTLVLREKGVDVTQHLLERVSQLPDELPGEAFRIERARLLNNLSVRLGALRRCEEALGVTAEAVCAYRQLAERRPDAFLPDLAMSVNNLGARLIALGRREEALAATEEAVRIRRQLAERQPDPFLPDLALSLNNLGMILSELGRHQDAFAASAEAVRVYRQLAEARPDAFLPDLAASLNNLGTTLSDFGRREDALAVTEDAVRVHRQLAEARPDAFLPDLATSLSNLGRVLSALDRREDALTATEDAMHIRRKLAERQPDAFLPDLAMSLNNLGMTLSALGRREEALGPTEEAVCIRRQLAKRQPDAFLPDMATSLGARGMVLLAMERHSHAARSFREGIETLRALFEKLPDAFAPLMRNLCGGYLEATRSAGQEPDEKLLAPVRAVFAQLQTPNEPTNSGRQRT